MGQGALIFLQDFKARFHPPVNEQYRSFALGIPVSLFNYAASQLAARHQAAIEFNQILKGAAFHHLGFELDHRSIVMIEHLIKDLKSVHRSHLLMEAAALEILNRFMIQLFDLTSMPEGLSKEDVRKLTEAALAVGYSNVSAFSEQFFREYGVKPSSLKKAF
nr:helix-turn-helix domain-containing protein [Paenibacillus ottowii]